MSFVRTVLGDIDPGFLGITYAHEHLIIDSAYAREQRPEISLPSVEEAIAEVNLCMAAGVVSMVDAMPIGAGRDPLKLMEVAGATGLNIVMATGLHLAKYYGEAPELRDADFDLVDRFVRDIEEGADNTAVRAGVIKVATESDPLSDRDLAVIVAAAEAHLRTGAPILTHCEEGYGGLTQVEELVRHGVPADRVVLSHTDKVLDRAFHMDLLESGVNVEYDQVLRQPLDAEAGTTWLTAEMCGAGFAGQIMLGTDGAFRSMWETLGGTPGLAWLMTGMVPQLLDRGVSVATIETILMANPARAFSFSEQS